MFRMSEELFFKIIFKKDVMCCDKPIESLPCLIYFTGPALVSSYFLTENLDIVSNNVSDKNTYATTFRGRILYGRKALLPKNYNFYVAKRLTQNSKLFIQF